MVIFYDCTELALTLCACLFARTECGPPTELAGWPDSLVQVQPHLDLSCFIFRCRLTVSSEEATRHGCAVCHNDFRRKMTLGNQVDSVTKVTIEVL